MKAQQTYLYIDQYGQRYYASTVKELRSQIAYGGSRVSKMYQDRTDGRYHIGYVIANLWLRKFTPYEKNVK